MAKTIAQTVSEKLSLMGYTIVDGVYQYEGEVVSDTMICKDVKSIVPALKNSPNSVILAEIAKILNKQESAEVVTRASIHTNNAVSQPVQLAGMAVLPNAIEKSFFRQFAYTVDPEGNTMLLMRNGNIWTRVGQGANGDWLLEEALLNSGMFETIYTAFERWLVKWETELVSLKNNGDEEALHEYVTTSIPMAILTRCNVIFHGFERESMEQGADKVKVFTSVEFSSKGNNKARLTFAEFARQAFDMYMPMIITKLDKMPVIFSNGEVDSFKSFDIAPYMDPLPMDQLPADWVEFFSKFTPDERDVYMAWIFGVFYSKNKSRQALCVLDISGYNAKSVLADVIAECAGLNLIGTINKDSMSTQFAFSSLWDRRLIIAGDSKNNRLISSEKVHMILGGDYVSVEAKGQTAFVAKMQSKILINTNTPLEIDPNLDHERTRLIIVKPKMTKEVLKKIAVCDDHGEVVYDDYGKPTYLGDPLFKDRLVAGFGTMMRVARGCYLRLCPKDSEFILSKSLMAHIYESEPTETTAYNGIFNALFDKDANSSVTPIQLLEAYQNLVNDQNNNCYKNFKDTRSFGHFKEFLTKNMGINLVRARSDEGSRERVYKGIKLKDSQALATLSARSFSYNKPSTPGEVK